MRSKTIISLLLSFLVILLAQIPAFATLSAAKNTAIVIDPIPGYSPGNGGPKTPVAVPIYANYDSGSSSVLLSFTRNLGEIEVDVLNSTNGGFCSDLIDTQYLYAVVPITFGSGHYIITFTLPSGQQYQGEFNKP